MRNKTHDCKEELRGVALKATHVRLAVMKFLEETSHPVDINSVIDYLKTNNVKTDPATVFRIMNIFTQKGITAPIEFQEGRTRYELANKADHHHLICERCGRVEDIEDNVIPALEKHIEEDHNFVVKRHSLEFFGLCAGCQK